MISLVPLVLFVQALTYSTWRCCPLSGPSAFARKAPAAWDLPASATTTRPRLVTMFLGRSSSPDKLDVLEKEMEALKHLLFGGNSLTAPEDIRNFVLIYEGGDKDWLRSMLKDLQREKVVDKETVLAISQAAVESKAGTLRVG